MVPRWVRAFLHIGRAKEIVKCVARVKNWLSLTAHYIGLARRYPVHLNTRSGVVVYLENHHDLVTAWIIFCRDEYQIPHDAEVVVDVGANIGLFTLYAATVAPRAKFVAVEPYPPCYRRLSAAMTENELDDRVVHWQMAVAGAAGIRFMSDLVDVSQSNGLLPLGTDGSVGLVPIVAITLPDLLARVRVHAGDRPIDFLKIDVEGAEHEFLADLPLGALDGVKMLAMEYHPNGDKTALFAALERQGLLCVHDNAFGPNVGVAHFRRRRIALRGKPCTAADGGA